MVSLPTISLNGELAGYAKKLYFVWIVIGSVIGGGVGLQYGWSDAVDVWRQQTVSLVKPTGSLAYKMYLSIYAATLFTFRIIRNVSQSIVLSALSTATFPVGTYFFDYFLNKMDPNGNTKVWTFDDLITYLKQYGSAYPFHLMNDKGEITTMTIPSYSNQYDENTRTLLMNINTLYMNMCDYLNNKEQYNQFINERQQYISYKQDKDAFMENLKQEYLRQQSANGTITLMLEGGSIIMKNPQTLANIQNTSVQDIITPLIKTMPVV
jgi:hypothetical protein